MRELQGKEERKEAEDLSKRKVARVYLLFFLNMVICSQHSMIGDVAPLH